tara:strand:+ start:3015 stop:3296 length:282 start_codon:yes stop_codon:yes gene_type:complete
MSILSIESYEDVLLDDDGITYEVLATVEDQVVTRQAVYNPPGKASPEELGPGLCWVAVTVPHNEDLDPENEEQFKIYLESQNLDWNVYNESVF